MALAGWMSVPAIDKANNWTWHSTCLTVNCGQGHIAHGKSGSTTKTVENLTDTLHCRALCTTVHFQTA